MVFPKVVLGPLLLIYVNDIPLQVKHGLLVEFADDTCLICCEGDRSSVIQVLCEDLWLLHLLAKDIKEVSLYLTLCWQSI